MNSLQGYNSDSSSTGSDEDSEKSIAHLKRQESSASDFNSFISEPSAPQSPKKRKMLENIAENLQQANKAGNTSACKVYSILYDQGLLNVKLRPIEKNVDTPPELQKKISLWTELRENGTYFNTRLLNTHAFRNPEIINKMQSFLDLDSNGTNFPSEIYDPSIIKTFPTVDELGSSIINTVSMAIKPKPKPQTPKNAEDARKNLYRNFVPEKSKKSKNWASRKRRI